MKLTHTLIAALSLLLLTGVARAGEKPLTVVELYTSQGCSSCPPADAYLGELAEIDDLLALSFHVDYWNYLGWADPYSSAVYSQRQSQYARYFETRNVYTPQMVIQGTHQVVGSDRSEVRRAIRAAKALPRVDLSITRDATGMMLNLPAAGQSQKADVFIVTFDNEHFTAVKRGENRGKKIRNRNVVRGIEHITDWNGQALTVPVSIAANSGDGGAVLVQSVESGAILGAATFTLN